ncbi:30S ribosomal protein S8 [bacterium]|nr:30S ribosomal protein S8 [bacterium]
MFHLADLVIQIKNGIMAEKSDVTFSFSKIKKDVLQVLKNSGLIEDFTTFKEGPHKFLKVILPTQGQITDIKIVSKPGRRVYTDVDKLKKTRRSLGIKILTTPKGVISAEEAIKQNVGGEIICKVW